MKSFLFEDNKDSVIKSIIISKIDSYGLYVTSYKNNDIPHMATVWIETGQTNHNKSLTYDLALELLEQITKAIEDQ